MSQYECNQWIASEHSEIVHGYKQDMSSKYHGYTNYPTFKLIQYLFDYEEFRAYTLECDKMRLGKEYDKTIVELGLPDSVEDRLAGIHFNSFTELKNYVCKNVKLDSITPKEYGQIDWLQVWEQLGHENEFGLASDIGLTGSEYEQTLRNNPELIDAIQNANTVAPTISDEERLQFKIENSKIILKSFLTRMSQLKGNKALKERYDELLENTKRVVKDLHQACRGFPITGDKTVDSYLSYVASFN